jgi:hypothetical protein
MLAISLVAAEEQITSPSHGLDWGNTFGVGRRGLHPGSSNLSRCERRLDRATSGRCVGSGLDGHDGRGAGDVGLDKRHGRFGADCESPERCHETACNRDVTPVGYATLGHEIPCVSPW